jgi:hypothetical protein
MALAGEGDGLIEVFLDQHFGGAVDEALVHGATGERSAPRDVSLNPRTFQSGTVTAQIWNSKPEKSSNSYSVLDLWKSGRKV